MDDKEREHLVKKILEALAGLSPLEAQGVVQTALDEAGSRLEVLVDPVTGKLTMQ